jgi:hypothetical protein
VIGAGIADAKALLANVRQDLERIIDQRSLISVTQNTKCASQRKPTTPRYCSPSPLVHDQYVRPLFRAQLNGFPFTRIEGGHQFGVGQGMERANPQPCRGLANPLADRARRAFISQLRGHARRNQELAKESG